MIRKNLLFYASVCPCVRSSVRYHLVNAIFLKQTDFKTNWHISSPGAKACNSQHRGQEAELRRHKSTFVICPWSFAYGRINVVSNNNNNHHHHHSRALESTEAINERRKCCPWQMGGSVADSFNCTHSPPPTPYGGLADTLVLFSFDATAQQRLDGFSPNLRQETSLRY